MSNLLDSSASKMDLARRVADEIESLHRFFERWFNGVEPMTQEVFSRVSRAWPESFSLVAPNGQVRSAEELLEATFAQHGLIPSLQVRIRNLDVRATSVASVAVAIREEWHIDANESEARLCSATLIQGPAPSRGWRWAHVHESHLRR